MADGAYQNFRGPDPRHPRGIYQTCGCQAPRGNAPPPPPLPPFSLEQLLAMQNNLMRRLVENDEHRGVERKQPQYQERDSSYSDFMAAHPLVFADATDPLEADS
jgi:hypothetical protein